MIWTFNKPKRWGSEGYGSLFEYHELAVSVSANELAFNVPSHWAYVLDTYSASW